MELNLQNIEDAIFFDKKVQSLLPEFRHLFDQWSLSKRVPGMQTLGKRTVIDFLNSLEAEHVRKLEEYFGTTIIVDKVEGHLVKNYEGDLELIEGELCKFHGFKEFSVYRDAEKAYITYWR
jgi:hypothetical protein